MMLLNFAKRYESMIGLPMHDESEYN